MKIGDKVIIYRKSTCYYWVPYMDNMVEESGTVVGFVGEGSSAIAFKADKDRGNDFWIIPKTSLKYKR